MGGSAALRDLAALAVRSGPFARAAAFLERIDQLPPGRLSVLAYHRVADPDERQDLDPALVSATPAELEEQAAFLAATGRVVSLDAVLRSQRGEGELPPGAILVTFDDAYDDFARNAWPVLRRHGVPVTLFVPTAYADGRERAFWWDRIHHALATTARRDAVDTAAGPLRLATTAERRRAVRLLQARLAALPHSAMLAEIERLETELATEPCVSPVLDWDELRRLAAEGVTLAPHSRTHPLLDRVGLDEAREEILGSLRDLEREAPPVAPAFAYPGGAHVDGVVSLVGDAGFEVAFTTERGQNDVRRADWLRLRRINVGRRATVPLLRVQLLSWSVRSGGPSATDRAPAGAA